MSIPKKVNNRISFASIQNQLDYPDFLEVQLKSFHEFFQLETTPENRKEFLKRGEEIRKKKLAEMKQKREDRIKAAKGGKRVK